MSGKPLVTLDSIAMRELVVSNQSGIWLVPAADPDALLVAVREAINQPTPVDLHAELRGIISPLAIGAELLNYLKFTIESR